MNFRGKLHRITNLTTFVTSYLQTGGKPTTGFTNYGKARVHLVTDVPSGQFSGGFPPAMSLKADTDSAGSFSFSLGDSLKSFRGQIVAFRTTTMASPIPGAPSIPLLDPIYRSAVFPFTDVSAAEQSAVQKIFIYEAVTPDESGISQATLDQQVKSLRSQLGLDKLKATITSGRVRVSAEKSGGELNFSAYVRGSLSTDLGRVIEIKAGEIDIDLPGPDFIVGLCVDEDEIEAQIRKGLFDLSKQVSQTLLSELDKQAPGVSSQATISVWRTRYVKTGSVKVTMPPPAPSIEVPTYSVVPDAAFGVPRKLY